MARQKWEEWVNDENRLAVLQAWARAGLPDEKIAKNIGISRSTLNEWKKKHESIREALSTGKEYANRQVENSLFRMTQGGMVRVRKAFKLKKVEYDKNGKRVKEEEYLDTCEEDQYIEPDIKAIIFWLKNQMPEEWKEKIAEHEAGEENQERMVVLTPREINEMKADISEQRNENKNEKENKESEASGSKKRPVVSAAETAGDDEQGRV